MSAIYIKFIRSATVVFFTIFNRIFVTPGWIIGRRVKFRGPIHRYSSFGHVKIGSDCLLGAFAAISTAKTATIKIGNKVSINQGTHLIAYESIEIGDGCRIGEYVCIRDANHGELSSNQSMQTKKITIGNNVWIGAHAVVLKGVQIGDDAIIAAAAVVTRDVPAGCTAAGVPARVIKFQKGFQ